MTLHQQLFSYFIATKKCVAVQLFFYKKFDLSAKISVLKKRFGKSAIGRLTQ